MQRRFPKGLVTREKCRFCVVDDIYIDMIPESAAAASMYVVWVHKDVVFFFFFFWICLFL